MSHQFKNLVLPMVLATCIASPVFAGSDKENGALKDAWLDGKLDTVVLLNEHLNPFKIETDVNNGVAVITGSVDSEIEKDLASELAYSIKGISDVENKLTISPEDKKKNANRDEGVMSDITDASITTAISTKLLLNTEIDSTDIDVDTDSKMVTLNGKVKSEAEKDLVYQIAKNTFEVKKVDNKLSLVEMKKDKK